MQVKSQICTERSGTDDPEQDDSQKKTSCFSNIKIFLVSECALMLAQGTVGAYLVSCSARAGASTSPVYILFWGGGGAGWGVRLRPSVPGWTVSE